MDFFSIYSSVCVLLLVLITQPRPNILFYLSLSHLFILLHLVWLKLPGSANNPNTNSFVVLHFTLIFYYPHLSSLLYFTSIIHVLSKQSFSPVLKPDLHNAHVQPRLSTQLLPDMAGGFRALVVCPFKGFQLFGGNRGTWAFAGIVKTEISKTLWNRQKADEF